MDLLMFGVFVVLFTAEFCVGYYFGRRKGKCAPVISATDPLGQKPSVQYLIRPDEDYDSISSQLKKSEAVLEKYKILLSAAEDNYRLITLKVDALTDALGIDILVDHSSYEPKMKIYSMRDDGLLGNAQEYISATLAADKMLGIHYQMIEQVCNRLRRDKEKEKENKQKHIG